jgi:PAT family beta-lactamase induction signal transducer AmpG
VHVHVHDPEPGTVRSAGVTDRPGLLDVFRSRRMAILFVFGFSSGLPLFLTGQTLKAWMTSIHVDLSTIGTMSLLGLAYTLKVAWAPFIDRYRLPIFGRLGRRRGWVLALQLALIVAIGAMGMVDPIADPELLFGMAIVVAFLSASQDVVLDAYNADLLAPHQRAAGSAVYVLGYRVGMLVTGTIALIMADHLPWRVIYATMAALMAIGIVGTLFAEEPQIADAPPATLAAAIGRPFVELWRRYGWRHLALLLGFAALYRFGDYFAQSLIMPFLHDGAGFSFTEIAVVHKTLALVGMAIGGFAAGGLVPRFGLRRMLVAFGVFAAITNLLYAALAQAGHNLPLFCVAVVVDFAATAMGTAAFLAVFMSACSGGVSATQFALLTSASSIGERVFGPFADDVVRAVGYSGFFVTTVAMAIPGLVLAWYAGKVFEPKVAPSPAGS